ncbi:hypothetical protein FRC12_010910 [Ceratobasidium sp. 428]|nr:hypothetical protein FRC12_010910 [Ceratobasidium sp. 428]
MSKRSAQAEGYPQSDGESSHYEKPAPKKQKPYQPMIPSREARLCSHQSPANPNPYGFEAPACRDHKAPTRTKVLGSTLVCLATPTPFETPDTRQSQRK